MVKRILSKSSIRDFEVEGFELESPLTVTMGRFLGILFLIYKMDGINRIIWGLNEIRWLKPAAQPLVSGAHSVCSSPAVAVLPCSARGRLCERETVRLSCD